MRLILTLRHWQILLLLLAYIFAVVGVLNLTGIQLPRMIEAFLFGWIPVTTYPLLLGLGLNRYILPLDLNSEKNFKSFLIFGSIWTIVFFASEVLELTFDTSNMNIAISTIILFHAV